MTARGAASDPVRQTCRMNDAFRAAIGRLDEDSFQALYGPWDPLAPGQVAGLLAGCGFRWWIAGGRAARVGAPPRRHDDTDVMVPATDMDEVRRAMRDWHLWEALDGALRPLLPGIPLTAGCGQLWVRADSRQPWRMEFVLDHVSTADEWVFKRDTGVRLPWARAVHTVDGVGYLRPEVALLYKARPDRPKDRADLMQAVLDPAGRAWLAETLERLGYREWAELSR
jgi:hypothetical protein